MFVRASRYEYNWGRPLSHSGEDVCTGAMEGQPLIEAW